ncbi:MAG: QueT transporter family protein [Ruminococcaceae bacterium]|nr:QueT transporter family protein [Oscillospiraceae bacterium]
MTNKKTRFLVESAIIAAIYAALTLAIYPLSYGAVQFRFSEALTVLPVFTPAAIPGLAVGCLIANLAGPMSWIDAIFGTLATVLAAMCTYFTRNIKFKSMPLLSLVFPVIFNALIIGLEINLFFLPSGEAFTFAGFLISALWVGVGEAVVCFLLGTPLAVALDKSRLFKKGVIR